MLLIGLILVCVLTIGVDGDTCKECKEAYTAATKGTDVEKCTAIKDHIKCLEDAAEEGCPLDATAITAITDEKTAAATTPCVLTGGCNCQYDYYTTDLTDDTEHCTAVKKRVSCLKLETDKGCGGTKTVVELATATKTKADAITTTCNIEKSCGCELAYAKADIVDTPKQCTAASAFLGCVVGLDGAGRCDTAGDELLAMVTTAAAVVSGDSSCTPTDVCSCAIEYSETDLKTADAAAKCSAAVKFSGCITKSVKDACSGNKMAIGTTVATIITGLGTNCAPTSVCTCEVDFNKMDVSDAKKCDSSKAYTTCLDGITDTTIKGCDGTSTTATLKTDHEKLELCTESGMKPLMASLAVVFISVFISMF